MEISFYLNLMYSFSSHKYAVFTQKISFFEKTCKKREDWEDFNEKKKERKGGGGEIKKN